MGKEEIKKPLRDDYSAMAFLWGMDITNILSHPSSRQIL